MENKLCNDQNDVDMIDDALMNEERRMNSLLEMVIMREGERNRRRDKKTGILPITHHQHDIRYCYNLKLLTVFV